ncbi:THO complex subunit 2 isoform X1 [Cinnamomum micranthum f. kanehirae]|uniref:THO complex subunit 2 n=1 Tax=Cinnamomum micranthum f. kanehirae TaxID=337451 RepID=A0A3S3MAM6_9MAGN|nr:THO complex subunit 2 isoform X1 [Cinnamomum micranthum f. kanehirae]
MVVDLDGEGWLVGLGIEIRRMGMHFVFISVVLSVDLSNWSFIRYHAQILFDRLSPLNPVAHIQICEGLFRVIEKAISSAYATFCQMYLQNSWSSIGSASDAFEQKSVSSFQSSFIDLPRELTQMLASAGPYLHRDAVLLQKHAAGGVVLPGGDGGSLDPRFHLREARSRVEEALGTCLLPSLQLIPANPAVGQEIWELMSLLPYEARYRLYGEWEKDDERVPMVLAARQTAKLDTRRILKRLAKENLKQLGRMVAKLAHANPMTVLRTIVHQIEAYKDMITPVVDAFKYLTQLEYDVLEYVVIERLAQVGREKLKDDGLNLSDWLQSLASFWGHLCKKYPSMELRGLFQYLVNQLKKGTGIELILLQELIQQMANVQYTENMTEEQLDAMAGSETLRYQATSFGITRNNKALIKSTNRLRDSLLPMEEPKLAIPLLLLIAQHRSMVIINADAPYIKMVSEQFDRCHGTLLQYVEFLYSAVTPATAYAQLIPSLDDLIHKYQLDPEVAFLIYRPVMRLFKCSSGPEVFWPSDVVEVASLSNVDRELDSNLYSKMVLDLGSPQMPITWSDLLDTVRSVLPSKAWNSLSPDLYATFWGLTLYDLYVPTNRYESEISKLQASLKALEELSDSSNSAITKRKKEKERIQELLDRLTAELRRHEENVASVRQRLAHEKDNWLSSCPDTLKINMEFLQRCIFPRCIFSMPDAVYCAMFVHTLHSLGTPFFNTVNHIDVLICKTLQPIICCCTEFEAGRLGRFLYETLKMAYHWKSDESIYERECGNKPGFAVYYRDPNSQRVTYGQFIRVHWKWSQRITRLLIQCLESPEYMEIRNALIVLTKVSSVFPVTRKSGVNLEKRVTKIKGDEREDLKVLATGVAAALAARKSSWVSDDEFRMGFVDLKPAASPAKPLAGNSVTVPNGSSLALTENAALRNVASGTQLIESSNSLKEQISRSKPVDGRTERSESNTLAKADSGQLKLRGGSLANGADMQSVPSTMTQSGTSRPSGTQKNTDELAKGHLDENNVKIAPKGAMESEAKPPIKRSAQAGSLSKQQKQDLMKEDFKTGKSASRTLASSSGDREFSAHPSEARQGGAGNSSVTATNGSTISVSAKASNTSLRTPMEGGAIKSADLRSFGRKESNEAEILDVSRSASSRPSNSPRPDDSSIALKSMDKQQKRTSPAEEQDRLNKRRKGDADIKDVDGELRFSDRERTADARVVDKSYPLDLDRSVSEEQNLNRSTDKLSERLKDKGNERYDRDHRERVERLDKSRSEDILAEKSRDRSIERYGREHSVERAQDRGTERSSDRVGDKTKDDRNKDDRNKPRYSEALTEKSHLDDRFHGQNLPPPPPLPPNVVPQSVGVSRREEDAERRVNSTRHMQRLSPRHEEKERRRSEENLPVSQDDAKRRREDDFRERKRDERDGLSMKVEEKERDKGNLSKDELDGTAATKRRKLKREPPPSAEAGGDYPLVSPSPPPLAVGISSQSYDTRERGDRKGAMMQRSAYMEDPVPRIHGKEAASKIGRRDNDQVYDRDWDEEKRQRVEPKRRHRK